MTAEERMRLLHYLDGIRRVEADADGAFESLVELGNEIIPFLTSCFGKEQDSRVRQRLVKAAWMTKADESLPLFAQALHDKAPNVWKAALDGLVTAGNSEALLIAQNGKKQADTKKSEWIDEAIRQIQEAMRDR